MTNFPPWLTHAWSAFGVAETPGPASSADILAYYRDAGHPEIRSDDVAWCAAFVGACLERAELRSTRSLLARSYLTWGDAIGEPRPGAIAVLSRGSDSTQGHVGYLVGITAEKLILLGGNHRMDFVTTYPFGAMPALWPEAAGRNDYAVSRGDVTAGLGVIILPPIVGTIVGIYAPEGSGGLLFTGNGDASRTRPVALAALAEPAHGITIRAVSIAF